MFLESVKVVATPILLVIFLVVLSRIALIQESSYLGYAILTDLTITIPFIYFLFIRKRNIPNLSTITFAIIGLFLAGWILPQNFHPFIKQLKHIVIPIVELTVFSLLLFKIYQFRKLLSSQPQRYPDAMQVLRESVANTFSNKYVAGALTTELSVFYYGFLSWKKVKPTNYLFTSYNNGSISLFCALILVAIAETLGFHFFLIKWNAIIAWIFTGSSIYLILQLFAHIKAILQRPISIEDGTLIIRYGIFMETSIPLESIESIQKNTASFLKIDGIEKIGLLGDTESHNLLVTLKNKETLLKPYGTRKLFKKLYFYVDEPDKLIGIINEVCPKKLLK